MDALKGALQRGHSAVPCACRCTVARHALHPLCPQGKVTGPGSTEKREGGGGGGGGRRGVSLLRLEKYGGGQAARCLPNPRLSLVDCSRCNRWAPCPAWRRPRLRVCSGRWPAPQLLRQGWASRQLNASLNVRTHECSTTQMNAAPRLVGCVLRVCWSDPPPPAVPAAVPSRAHRTRRRLPTAKSGEINIDSRQYGKVWYGVHQRGAFQPG